MRILFVTATRIGDAVLSTGLLSHVIARFPEARLTIAAGPAAIVSRAAGKRAIKWDRRPVDSTASPMRVAVTNRMRIRA